MTFTVEDFLEDTEYEVSVDGNLALTFTTDDLGFGSFTLNFASQHLVVIEGQGIAPPPPDGTPPAPVTDLTAEVVESDYVILRWT
ncbi:MAG: hypothetical protein GTO63_36845, partial [Anaerolineae bacterium]|nr:hypothetical protein [Anaerolineae bacterium]NIO00323.1 hypothetical protein [Anaerolineae bacterium]